MKKNKPRYSTVQTMWGWYMCRSTHKILRRKLYRKFKLLTPMYTAMQRKTHNVQCRSPNATISFQCSLNHPRQRSHALIANSWSHHNPLKPTKMDHFLSPQKSKCAKTVAGEPAREEWYNAKRARHWGCRVWLWRTRIQNLDERRCRATGKGRREKTEETEIGW